MNHRWLEKCPEQTLGYILEGIQHSERTPDLNSTTWLTNFLRTAWRNGWSEGWQGRKRQQGTGWNTAEGMREDKSFQLSVQLCICVCGCTCAHACACVNVFIWASLRACSLANVSNPSNDMFSWLPCGLYRQRGDAVCAMGKDVVCWGRWGHWAVSPLDGGGDGRGSVRPAALLWRVTSSPGPWHCGSSTKPCRGTEREDYTWLWGRDWMWAWM